MTLFRMAPFTRSLASPDDSLPDDCLSNDSLWESVVPDSNPPGACNRTRFAASHPQLQEFEYFFGWATDQCAIARDQDRSLHQFGMFEEEFDCGFDRLVPARV